MKLFFYDVETTGTNFWQHGIHQISGCVEIDGVVKEYFDIKVQPNPAAKIDDQSLAVSNVTREQIAAYMPFKDGYSAIIEIVKKYVNKYDPKDKFFLVGFNNAGFDDKFFRAFFVQNGDNYFGSWFWSHAIDVMVLAGHYLMLLRPEMINFKQMTVARQLGIEVDESKLHDAEYDVSILMKIYDKVAVI